MLNQTTLHSVLTMLWNGHTLRIPKEVFVIGFDLSTLPRPHYILKHADGSLGEIIAIPFPNRYEYLIHDGTDWRYLCCDYGRQGTTPDQDELEFL